MIPVSLQFYDNKTQSWRDAEIIEVEDIDDETVSILFIRDLEAKSEVVELNFYDAQLEDGVDGFRIVRAGF